MQIVVTMLFILIKLVKLKKGKIFPVETCQKLGPGIVGGN
jgi:hypothetical protein